MAQYLYLPKGRYTHSWWPSEQAPIAYLRKNCCQPDPSSWRKIKFLLVADNLTEAEAQQKESSMAKHGGQPSSGNEDREEILHELDSMQQTGLSYI